MITSKDILTYLEIQFSIENDLATTINFLIYLLGSLLIAYGNKYRKLFYFCYLLNVRQIFVTGCYFLLILISIYVKIYHENSGVRVEDNLKCIIKGAKDVEPCPASTINDASTEY